MLKFDKKSKALSKVYETSLKKENLLEREDLQKAIISSWETFRNEIGFPSAVLIGQEINPDPSTLDRLDILALDSEDNSLVVFELKREKNKLQLLQAISYAAMLSSKNKDEIIKIAKTQMCFEYEELIDTLEASDLNSDIKVILIAESFYPETIITADWLKGYGVTVYAFGIEIHSIGEDIHFRLEQKYPLKELSEVYDIRRVKQKNNNLKELTWKEVILSCEYKFAEKAVNMLSKLNEGDPSRKRFVRVIKNFQGFTSITFFFRRKHIQIYLWGGDDSLFENLFEKLEKTIQTGTIRGGFSLIITTENEFKSIIKLDHRFSYYSEDN